MLEDSTHANLLTNQHDETSVRFTPYLSACSCTDTESSRIRVETINNTYSPAIRKPSMVTHPWAREYVVELTAILSVVSLALVFGAALQLIPAAILPQSAALLDVIPHLHAVISLTAIGTILLGIRQIRRGDVESHRRLMVTSFVLFAGFLFLYLYRVAIIGPHEFPGPETVRTFVYLPFLAVHILLAVICVPFVFFALLSAATRPVQKIYDTAHRRAGRIAAGLWLVSFAMGIVIYALLYHVY